MLFTLLQSQRCHTGGIDARQNGIYSDEALGQRSSERSRQVLDGRYSVRSVKTVWQNYNLSGCKTREGQIFQKTISGTKLAFRYAVRPQTSTRGAESRIFNDRIEASR